MDELNKKSVRELRSILRVYKNIHCKPYSKLNKVQMIELIVYFNLLDKTDMTTIINNMPAKPPKKEKVKKEKKPKTEIIKEPQPIVKKAQKAKVVRETKPILFLEISHCKTILRHSHSRGFKSAKTTFAPSNFYNVSVKESLNHENFGYTKNGVHQSSVEFEGIPSDKQIISFIIGRHLFSLVHVEGGSFNYGGDNQCGRETKYTKIFKGDWDGKGDNPTKTHFIDLKKYHNKPKPGEENMVLKKFTPKEMEKIKAKSAEEKYEDEIKKLMEINKNFTREDAIAYIAKEDDRFERRANEIKKELAKLKARNERFEKSDQIRGRRK